MGAPREMGRQHAERARKIPRGRALQVPGHRVQLPADAKAVLYARERRREDRAAMDLLVPGIGEIIGGSQREERLDVSAKTWRTTNSVRKITGGTSTSAVTAAYLMRDSAWASNACSCSSGGRKHPRVIPFARTPGTASSERRRLANLKGDSLVLAVTARACELPPPDRICLGG